MAGLLLLWWQVGLLLEDNFRNEIRKQVTAQIDSYGASLTQAVNRRLSLVSGLHSFVKAELFGHATLDKEEFAIFAAGLYDSMDGIRDIALAPDGVMQFVYPYEENKSVLGYEPAKDVRPNVRSEVQRAVETRQIVLSLPYELIQGGTGVIARQAIFVEDTYWGLANIVVDVAPMLEDAGIVFARNELNLAIKDQSGRVFYGLEDVFDADPVTYSVFLPEGTWELAGVPTNGWDAGYQHILWLYQFLGLCVVGASTLVVYQLSRRQERLGFLVKQRTRALQESETKYRELVDSSLVGIYITQNYILQFCNQGLADLFGYQTPDEMIGMHIRELVAPENWTRVDDEIRLRESGEEQASHYEFKAVRVDGTIIDVEVLGVKIDYQGQPAIQGVLIDITERVRAEERFRALSEAAFEAVFISEKGVCLEQNLTAEKMFGYTLSEAVGRLSTEWVVPEDRDLMMKNITSGYEEPYQATALRKDGTTFPAEIQGKMMSYKGRTVRVTVLRDITKQVQAERALRSSETKYRELVDNSLVGIYIMQGHVLKFCNQGFADLFGYRTPDEMIGMHVQKLIAPDHWEQVDDKVRLRMSGKTDASRYEFQAVRADGSIIDVEVLGKKISYQGQPAIQGILIDITERVRAENETRQSKMLLENILRTTPSAVFTVDTERRITGWNLMAERITGYKAEEVTGKRCDILASSTCHQECRLFNDDFKKPGKYRECVIVGKDGREIITLKNFDLLSDHSGEIIGGIESFVDITERKRAENALREAEAKFKGLAEKSLVGIYIIQDGLFRYVNPRLAEIFGYTTDELIDRLGPKDLTTPEAWPTVNENLRKRLSGEANTLHYVFDGLRKDGEQIIAEAFGTRTTLGDQPAVIGTLLDITGRVQADADLRRRLAELEVLYENSQAIGQSREPQKIAQKVIKVLTRELDWHHAAIRLYRPQTDTFELLAFHQSGLKNARQRQVTEKHFQRMISTPGQGLSGLAVQSGRSIRSGDVTSDPRYVETYPDIRSGLYVPIKSGESVLGVISIESEKPDAFSEADERLLSIVAGQMASALENARLFAAEYRRAVRLAGILRLSTELSSFQDEDSLLKHLVTQTATLTKSAACTVMLLDENTNEAVVAAQSGLAEDTLNLRVPLSLPILRQMIETGDPLVVSNVDRDAPELQQLFVQPGIKSFFAYPMMVKDRLLGFLTMSSLSPEQPSTTKAAAYSLLAERTAAALQNIRLFVEARRRADEMAALLATSRAISTLELDAVLETIARQVKTLFDADGSRIHLLDPDGETLRCAVVFHMDEKEAMALPLKLGQGATGHVAQTGIGEIINNSLSDSRIVQTSGMPNMPETLALVPLKVHERIIGVMTISRQGKERPFSPADLTLLTAFAEQAAVAIENSRLFDEAQRQLTELEAVNKISYTLRVAKTVDELLPILLDETLAALDTDSGMIWLHDLSTDRLRKAIARGWMDRVDIAEITPGKGLVGSVFLSGDVYFVQEFARDALIPAAVRDQIPAGFGGAAIPIRVGDEPIGVMLVSVPLPRKVTVAEIKLLTSVVDIGGVAIHRTRLHTETEQRVRQLAALRSVDQAINASLDLHSTLRILLGEVTSLLGVDAVDVLLFQTYLQTLEPVAELGFRGTIPDDYHWRLGRGYAGRVALERVPLHIPDLRQAPDLPHADWIEREGFVAYYGLPLVASGQIKGVLEIYHRAPLEPGPDWLEFLEALARQAAIAVDKAQLLDGLQRSNLELTRAYDATVESWGHALELRDKETEGHTRRVTELTERLARRMGVSESDLVHIRRGASLHDIGKISVPDSILRKNGPLTEEEWVIMRHHPRTAYELLTKIDYLRPALDIPYFHHEKWDGTGYPRGLEGDAIPLAARIFAVVDVYDALTSDRPYRGAWPEEKALKYIRKQSGTHFDPQVVDAFLKMLAEEQ
ncbi:MAG: PAS domain S-box protein [Chloroflexi bacterium]|nr:PAS domain S-box protein [Chloroflexota bacterium]